MITKYSSAAQRATIDTCRTLIIWFVFLCIGSEKFLVGELFGFALLVLGTLVYNEIIEVPIDFLSRNTKRNIKAREEKEANTDAKPALLSKDHLDSEKHPVDTNASEYTLGQNDEN